ncbi:phosphate ABC transporter permease PstA [Halobaculum sp. CBA1158]|uniref:phosphate ABC transporter permease PstA n=1 Tax=Halobaculum sp. CBA1158 TaxID=2904243 RepID=UPI001F1867E3|nr:phosphate ABC transporter permease PstA [Halobaculum sp. CBA1158]UIO99437.1 phosphate ABC transporter permease PstA [Halobaculum sp. CBA1158]
MATDTATGDIEGFGTVSRTVGTVFRYVMLAATLFGLVVLGVLLVYVANDAIQPLTADPGWHLTFLLTLVVPTLGVGAYLYRRDADALGYGALTVGTFVVTLMFGGGAAMIFVDILPPLLWLAYVVAFAVPFGVVLAIQRRARRIPFLTRAAATTAAFYLSLFGLPGPIGSALGIPRVVPGVPGLVQSAPFVPLDWMSVTATLGLGVAGAVGWYVVGIRDRRAGLLSGGAAFAGIVVAALAGPAVGLDPLPAVVLASVSVVPTVAYAVGTAVDRPTVRVGLLVPLVVIGGALVGEILVGAFGFAGPQSWVDWQFLTSAHSRTAENAGLYPAIGGSILLMVTVAGLSFPLGVGAAVYLEEYAPDNVFTRIIDVNISNLAGVPSVVYGLLGLGVFVTYLGQPTGTVIIGGATLALLILPIVIISSREAIRSVPNEMRQASYGMGATKWQTVRRVVLPRAFPGILTGTILALGRAIGETAPLIMIGAPSVLFSLPTEFTSKVSAMPLQVFAWSSLFASEDFYTKAVPAGVVVLVSVLLAMNSVAIVLRNRYQSEQ